MTTYAKIYTDGTTPDDLTEAEALEILARPNVSETFTVTVPDTDGNDVECDSAEIYGTDETPDDYPDGDPDADAIVIIPTGYVARARGTSLVLKAVSAHRPLWAIAAEERDAESEYSHSDEAHE